MMSRVEQRLAEHGLTLPAPAAPAGNFLPFIIDQSTVYLAGQTNHIGGQPSPRGKMTNHQDLVFAQEAARVCGINLLACLKLATNGDLDRVERCISVRGFVSVHPDFVLIPAVINGASDLFVLAFGEAGKHVRTAVGVASLPGDALVEVDAIFRLRS